MLHDVLATGVKISCSLTSFWLGTLVYSNVTAYLQRECDTNSEVTMKGLGLSGLAGAGVGLLACNVLIEKSLGLPTSARPVTLNNCKEITERCCGM
jgi:hypothetical protein